MKHYIKFFTILLAFFSLTNCQNDTIEIIEKKSEISLKKIYSNEINDNEAIVNKLEKFNSRNTKSINQEKSNFIYNAAYDFNILTNKAIFIELEEYNSYTFEVYRNSGNSSTENLLLSLQDDNTYKAYLVNYEINQEERNNILTNEAVNLDGKVSFQEIDFNFDSIINQKSDPVNECPPGKCCDIVFDIDQKTGWPITKYVEVPCPQGDQDTEIDAGDSSTGGDVSNPTDTFDNSGIDESNFPDSSDNGGGGTSGSTNDGDSNNANDQTNTFENCILDVNGSCIGDITSPVISKSADLTNNYLDGILTPEQLDYLTNYSDINIAINEFLNGNRDMNNLIIQEAKDFALTAINFLMNNEVIYNQVEDERAAEEYSESDLEPVKAFAGTISDFKNLLDNSPRGVGKFKGQEASYYLKSLGETEFNFKQMRPLPTQTGFFNDKVGRYIYTRKGGWIDMGHFMFYAGKAYDYKLNGENNPIGEAVQDGYNQEFSDRLVARHSAYSYEDLPSDRFGAEFAVNYFDQNSSLTFGQQIENYFINILEATEPSNAPNFNEIPDQDSRNTPSRTNNTTTPVYTNDNP